MALTIPRRIHEAATFLEADYRNARRAIREAIRRSTKAKALNLLDEWDHWGGVAAYLTTKDGAVYQVVD
jgi:hypothetical protein